MPHDIPYEAGCPAAVQAPDPEKVMTPDDELYRRSILARSRNYLLSYALRNHEWVLWLDVDIVWVRCLRGRACASMMCYGR